MVAVFIQDSAWHGVTDAKERKRRQDRLAQRARRKRLASKNSDSNETNSPSSSSDTKSSSSIVSSCPSPEKFPSNGTAFVLVPELTRDDRVLTEVPISVFAALFNNGQMLGLTCGCLVPAKSSPCSALVPAPLQPTPLQLTSLHQTWIDRFPFPKMRDNMISLNRIFEEEDFLRDLFCMRSFDIKPDRPGWDPSAWIISREFSKKWGFLFY